MTMVKTGSGKTGRIECTFPSNPWLLFMWFFTSEETPVLSFPCIFLESDKHTYLWFFMQMLACYMFSFSSFFLNLMKYNRNNSIQCHRCALFFSRVTEHFVIWTHRILKTIPHSWSLMLFSLFAAAMMQRVSLCTCLYNNSREVEGMPLEELRHKFWKRLLNFPLKITVYVNSLEQWVPSFSQAHQYHVLLNKISGSLWNKYMITAVLLLCTKRANR